MTAIESDIQAMTDRLHEVAIERAALEERLRELDKAERELRSKLSGLRVKEERVKRTKTKYQMEPGGVPKTGR